MTNRKSMYAKQNKNEEYGHRRQIGGAAKDPEGAD